MNTDTAKFKQLTEALQAELTEAIEAEAYSVSVLKKLQCERVEMALQLDRMDKVIQGEQSRRESHTNVLLSTLKLIHHKNMEVHKTCKLCKSSSCYSAWYYGTDKRVKIPHL